jgi:hypothetical protein
MVGPKKRVPTPAILRTRLLPSLELSMHLACVTISIIIFVLYSRNVYFLDFGHPNLNSILNALQFAAKGHDILLGASLAAIVLFYLQHELCAAQGVPLGYVSCALQLSRTNQLLSREFWGIIPDRTRSKSRTQWFGAVVLFGTVIAAILGPSSAILIIPDLDWWPLPDPFSGHGGLMYLNRSYDTLWPSQINASMIPNLEECLHDTPLGIALPPSCPFNMMTEISQWLLNNYNRGTAPNLTKSADLGVIRYLTSSNENTSSQRDGTQRGYSVGSAAMTHLSRNLDAIGRYADKRGFAMTKSARPLLTLSSSNNSNPLRRPLVQVQCGFPYDITHVDIVNVTFPSDQLHSKHGSISGGLNLSSIVDANPFRNITSGPIFQWIDLSQRTGRPILGGLVGMKFFSPQLIFGSSFKGDEAFGLMPCTIESYWIPTRMSLDPMFGNTVVLDTADPMDAVKSAELMEQALDLYIDLSYLDVLNTAVPDREPPLGVIAWELNWLSYKPGNGFDGVWKDRWPWLVATVLSLQLTDGLTRYADVEALYYWDIPPNSPINKSFVVDLRYSSSLDVYDYSLPAKYGRGFAEYIRGSPQLHTEVVWTVKRFGYAWGFGRATKYLALIVVASHTLWILVYISLVIVGRWRCAIETSVADLLILALQSPRSKLVEGSGLGMQDRPTTGTTIQILEDIIEGKYVVLEAGEDDRLLGYGSTPFDQQGAAKEGAGIRKLKAEKKYL